MMCDGCMYGWEGRLKQYQIPGTSTTQTFHHKAGTLVKQYQQTSSQGTGMPVSKASCQYNPTFTYNHTHFNRKRATTTKAYRDVLAREKLIEIASAGNL
jgi:hypothetical protein